MLNAKVTILKKINVSFIVNFCLGKYSFRFNICLNIPGENGKEYHSSYIIDFLCLIEIIDVFTWI